VCHRAELEQAPRHINFCGVAPKSSFQNTFGPRLGHYKKTE